MSVDSRLLPYWKEQQAARRRARRMVPEALQDRPQMELVTELYLEIERAERPKLYRLPLEDR